MKRLSLLVVLSSSLTAVSQAALFSGGAFFGVAPTSQLGPVTNNTTITNTPTGFTVTGQFLINTFGTSAGTLLYFEIWRPLDPTYGSSFMGTTTLLDGFSAPPAGAIGNTSGNVRSDFTNFPGVSQSLIPMNLIAGAQTWPNLSNNSGAFSYTSGGTNYLRMVFDLDGVILAGPPGTWTIDVPASSLANPVPEPATVAALGFGLLALMRRRRKS